MIDYLMNLNPVLQAFIASMFTYLFTIMGSALVFPFKNVNRNVMDALLAGSSGLMLAASFFSLLMPAIDVSKEIGFIPWAIVSLGVIIGGLLLFITDRISQKYLKDYPNASAKKRTLMLLFSITVHNIPEGMVVGVAFASIGVSSMTFVGACILTLGIAIQNFPEGSALSIPMRRDGMNTKKAFFLGQISGIVEPIAGVLGALIVINLKCILPIALSFAAGAMIYVVVEELIPESQTNKRKDLMALFTILGFILMMVLDISLG